MFFKKKKKLSKNDKAVIDLKSNELEDFVERQDPKRDFLGEMSSEEIAKAISDVLKKSKSN